VRAVLGRCRGADRRQCQNNERTQYGQRHR
jgi:hypothetical protein